MRNGIDHDLDDGGPNGRLAQLQHLACTFIEVEVLFFDHLDRSITQLVHNARRLQERQVASERVLIGEFEIDTGGIAVLVYNRFHPY